MDISAIQESMPKVRIVLGTMTFGPAVGNAHIDGKYNPLPAYCQTPPSCAKAQLLALLNSPAALVEDGPEKGKCLIDTASAYQNGFTEKVPFVFEIFNLHKFTNYM